MKKSLSTILFVAGMWLLSMPGQADILWKLFCDQEPYRSRYAEPQQPQQLSILVAGDLMQHDEQIKAAWMPDGRYDYSSYFAYIKPEIERADVAIANLEVTLGGRPYKGYPMFSAPDEYLSAIKEGGFDLLLTANNHCCDRGKKGLVRTIEMCDSLQIPHLGTYVSPEERERNYPYLLEKNGFRIALLDFTYGTNGMPTPAGTCVNLIDTAEIAADILKAKSMDPDVIIAFAHWGIEYETRPRKEVVRLAQWLIDHGVDHIIGGHPHVVQPIELREDPIFGKQHLVAYSLGNHVSDQASFPRYGGMMLRIELEKDKEGRVRLDYCGYMLTFVSRPAWSGHKAHRVYPVDFPDEMLNDKERQKRDDYVRMARELFSKYNQNIQEYLMNEKLTHRYESH